MSTIGELLINISANNSGLKRAMAESGVAVQGFEGSIAHLKGTIGGLVSGPLGFLGLGAGVLGFAGALHSGISTASTMALSIEKLTALTGESAQAMSGLAAVTGKYGVDSAQLSTIVGFEEKTVGKLAETYTKATKAGASHALQSLETQKLKIQEAGASTKVIDKLIAEQTARDKLSGVYDRAVPGVSKLVALQNQYHVQLTNSKGSALDFSQILSKVSDYYDSNATAGQKAALAATLFGRGYAAMIPVLQLGSKGFAEAQAAAESLGLTLTDQNAAQLKQYQETMRDLGDAVGGLQLQLSLALVPALEDVAKAATAFISQNKAGILAFFDQLLAGARSAAAWITGDLIPSLQQMAKVISDGWNKIPPELRDIIVKGFVAGRVMKFLFGFDPVTAVGSLIGKQILTELSSGLGGIVKNVFGSAVGTAASDALGQRVFVTNFPPSLGGGSPVVTGGEDAAAAAAAGGSAGFLADLAAGLGPLAIAAAVPLILNALINGDPTKTGLDDLKARQEIAAGRGLDPSKVASAADMVGGRRSNALPSGLDLQDYGAAVGRAADQLTAIKENTQPLALFPSSQQATIGALAASEHADAMAGNAYLASMAKSLEHQTAKNAVGGSGAAFHDFLLAFRSGNTVTAIKDFDKELAYLSTASDAQKQTPTFIRGVQENVAALQRAMVGATSDQKTKLSADIVRMQALLLVPLNAIARNAAGGFLGTGDLTGGKLKDDQTKPPPIVVHTHTHLEVDGHQLAEIVDQHLFNNASGSSSGFQSPGGVTAA